MESEFSTPFERVVSGAVLSGITLSLHWWYPLPSFEERGWEWVSLKRKEGNPAIIKMVAKSRINMSVFLLTAAKVIILEEK
jgi:hypothetical protein